MEPMLKKRRSTPTKSRHKKFSPTRIPFGVWIIIVGVTSVLAAVVMVSQNGASAAYIEPANDETYALGQKVFADTCATCHGPSGEGDIGPPMNGSGHTWHHLDDYLRTTVRDGIPGTQMQGHEDHLTPEEIDAVIAFVKTWWTPEQQVMQRTGRHPM